MDLVLHPRYAVRARNRARPGHGAARTSSLPFRVDRWGRRSLGVLEITLRDRWRLTEGHATVELPTVDCYPRPAAQQTRVVLSRLPSRLGEHPSRSPGEGVEFTGVREFVPGDRQRRINWPATTRRGRLQLNTFAAERTQNVVILADASSDVGEPGPPRPTSPCAARPARPAPTWPSGTGSASSSTSPACAGSRPGLGARQYYRIMDLMLAEPRLADDALPDAGIARLPRAALPPGSLILVFSPLLDRRLVETLRDLRRARLRGPDHRRAERRAVGPGPASAGWPGGSGGWSSRRSGSRCASSGIPLVHWDGEQSLDEPLAPYTRRVMVSRR